MDLAKVLAELKRELANLDAAILSLEKLQASNRKRGNLPRAEEDSSGQESEAADSSGAAAVRAREKGRL